jgi:glycosyltransferase involved in cell wall biosynthesis
MTYDLIIVSQSKGDLIQVTQNCINSARKDTDLNIIVVETGQPYKYDVDKIVEYNGEFNYNRALNLGLKYAKSDYQILANNDIIFHEAWSVIGDLMNHYGYLSACAWSTDPRQKGFNHGYAYEGYKVGYQLVGWCIFTSKNLWPLIGKLNEKYQFWYSDNIYAKQLKDKGIKHALISSVRVDHIGSQTLIKQDKNVQRKYTFAPTKEIREFRNV